MSKPVGLGMWIAYFGQADGGDVSAIIDRCHRNGIRWLAIRGNSKKEREGIAKVTGLLQAAKLDVFGWKYNYPGQPAKEADAAKAIYDAGVQGYILNPEVEFKRTSGAASALCEAIRKAHPDAYLSYAPFALPGYHPDYPYKEFQAHCDSVMPQVYWTEFNDSGAKKNLDRFDDHWRVWNGKNPELVRPILPIGVTYGRGTSYASVERSKTMGEFRHADLDLFLTRYPQLEALSLYSYEASFPSSWELLERHETARQRNDLIAFDRLPFVREA